MAPKIYQPGKTLSDAEKGEILQDVSKHKASEKAKADAAKAAKVSAELGIKKAATGKAAAGSGTDKKPAAGTQAHKKCKFLPQSGRHSPCCSTQPFKATEEQVMVV